MKNKSKGVGSVGVIVGLVFNKNIFLPGLLLIFLGVSEVLAQNLEPTIDPVSDEIIDEDDGIQTVPLAGISDGGDGGQTITITATSSNPGLIPNANISINYNSPDVTGTLFYTPLTDAFGATTVTVTVMDDGGTSPGVNTKQISFLVTVNPINDPPSFTKGSDIPAVGELLEDPGIQNVFNWATNINAGGTIGNEGAQILTFNVTVTGTIGNIAFDLLSINSSGILTFQPTLNTNGTATIDVELIDDGPSAPPHSNTGNTETFTITVTAVNDPPVFTGGGNVNVDEGAGPQVLSGWATGISPGGGTDEALQKVTFNLVLTNLTGTMNFTSDPFIDSISGDLIFEADSSANGIASYLLSLIDDGPGVPPDQNTSSAITLDIVVNAINDPPEFSIPDSLAVLEDAGLVTIVNFATDLSPGPPDESTQRIDFKISTTPIEGNLTFIKTPSINEIGTLTFEPSPDSFGTVTLDVILEDDGQSLAPHINVSDTVQLVLEVIGLNDAPSFVKSIDPAIDEDSGPQIITAWAKNVSPGAANESDQALDYQLTSTLKQGNIAFASAPDITSEGNLVFEVGPDLNGSEFFEIRLVDDGPADSINFNTSTPPLVVKIIINPVNDAPVFTVGPDLTIDDNVGFTTVEAWATGVSPGGGSDELSQEITFNIEPVRFTGNLVFAIGPLVGPTGDISYHSAPNTWGEAEFEISLSDDGSNEVPNVNISENQTFKLTVTEVNDPPTGIILSNNNVVDTAEPGNTVGTFTAIDPDTDTHTFALVDGVGSGDNGDFLINGDQLITNTEFDLRIKNLYTIRVSASDELNIFEEFFLIEISSEEVNSVTFPSAFTPNNDGENDKWIIERIEYFPRASINIYTKTGQNVFSSIGYLQAWDGSWNNNLLPEDTYYVVIDLKNETPVIQGTITILR